MAAKLFGNSIAPCCDYCARNQTPDLDPTCDYTINDNGKCSKFQYDPLLRCPKVLPPLKSYSPDEFSL